MHFIKYFLLITSLFISINSMGESVITISAAISLKNVFDDLRDEFVKENSNYQININYASSGSLRQQIEAGAPVDIFASASSLHMNQLEKKQLTLKGTRYALASNSLVLVRSSASSLKPKISLTNLGKSKLKRIAIGNPLSVPAGEYAKEVLQNVLVWESLKEKIIFGDHVRQVYSYIKRQEVDLGILYYTDYILNQNQLQILEKIPLNLHSSIRYPMVLLQKNKLEFYTKWKLLIKGSKGQRLFKQYGFGVI